MLKATENRNGHLLDFTESSNQVETSTFEACLLVASSASSLAFINVATRTTQQRPGRGFLNDTNHTKLPERKSQIDEKKESLV